MKKSIYMVAVMIQIVLYISFILMTVFLMWKANGWPFFFGIIIFSGIVILYNLIRVFFGTKMRWYDWAMLVMGYLPALAAVILVIMAIMFGIALGHMQG